jgi:hypothetical protein
MPIKLIKLLPLAVMAAQAFSYYLYRAHRGWPLDFAGLPWVEVRYWGDVITVTEGSKRLPTAGSSLIGFRLGGPWTFALARQDWLRMEAELVTGVREIDQRFHIGIESTRFADALIDDADLWTHLFNPGAVLDRFEARFERLKAQGCELSMRVTCRRAADRAPLWHALIDWLVVFDAALAATGRTRCRGKAASAPRRPSTRPAQRSSCAGPAPHGAPAAAQARDYPFGISSFGWPR